MKRELRGAVTEWNRSTYREFLKQWNWEWLLTARLTVHSSFGDPSFTLKEFRTRLLRKEHGQIGTMGIFVNGEGGPHMHVLMLGRFPGGRTLRDIDEKHWEEQMTVITKKSCRIGHVDDELDRVVYVVKAKNTPAGKHGFHELLAPWGRILDCLKVEAGV